MKPVANKEVLDEITVGSKWKALRGSYFSVSAGNITVTRIISEDIHYSYDDYRGYSYDFCTDRPTFLQYARRIE